MKPHACTPSATLKRPPVRVVVDCRVLRSAVWGGRSSTVLIDAWLEGGLHFCVTESIMRDYFQALRRLEDSPLVRTVLDRLRSGDAVRAFVVPPTMCPEDVLLECARRAEARAVITHDANLLDLGQVGGVSMESPGGFVNNYLQPRHN